MKGGCLIKKIDFKYSSFDGKDIATTKYITENPIGVVQIAHGMAEHRKRYSDFAEKLTDEGYSVYINDHRGHGETAGKESDLGFFAEKDGWNSVVSDMYKLTKLIKDENDSIPIFLFGHSMGSFLTRTYITRYGKEIDGAIICGTSQIEAFLLKMILPLAKLEKLIKGQRGRSWLIDKIFFASSNKSFKPIRTKLDWLSRDEKIVDEYIEDKYCGFKCTTAFFEDFIGGMKYLAYTENFKTIPFDLPMFFISGENDPVSNKGLGVKKISENYRKIGIKDASFKIYSDCRHEILNEVNKEEIYSDIVNWLNEKNKTERFSK